MIRLGWRRDRPWSSVADPGQLWATGSTVSLSDKPTNLRIDPYLNLKLSYKRHLKGRLECRLNRLLAGQWHVGPMTFGPTTRFSVAVNT